MSLSLHTSNAQDRLLTDYTEHLDLTITLILAQQSPTKSCISRVFVLTHPKDLSGRRLKSLGKNPPNQQTFSLVQGSRKLEGSNGMVQKSRKSMHLAFSA